MSQYRVVLDTNVLLSAIGWEGTPGAIFEACIKRESILVLSPDLLDEFKNTIARQKFDFIPVDEKELFFSLLAETAEMTSPQARLDIIQTDPSDNRVLECALSAGANYIISGDKHLLSLKSFGGVKIVSPRKFLALMNK